MALLIHKCPAKAEIAIKGSKKIQNAAWISAHRAVKKENGQWWWQLYEWPIKRPEDVRQLTDGICPACEQDLESCEQNPE